MWKSALVLSAGLLPALGFGQINFGDWTVVNADDQSGDVIAATATESGNELLGYRCFVGSGECTYVLVSGNRCDDKAEYPMLVNAPSGAALIAGVCHHRAHADQQFQYQFALTPYKVLESSIKGATGLVGIAVPLESGAFRAVRFSIRGAIAATQVAEARASARRNARGPSPLPQKPRATTF